MTLAFKDDITLNELRIQDYTVHYYHPTLDPERKIWDLTPLVRELKWSDNMDQAALEVDIKLMYHESLKTIIKEPGGLVTIFGNAIYPNERKFDELFRVVIFTMNTDTEDNSAPWTLKCYDHMIYTAHNDETKIFRNVKASQIIRELCTEFGIPVGEIDDTGVIISRLVFRKQSIYDMMIIALTKSRYTDGQRYWIRMDRGLLYVKKKTTPSRVFVLEYGRNLYGAGLHKSIEKMRNRIKLYGSATADKSKFTEIASRNVNVDPLDNDDLILYVTLEDSDLIQKYGLMQHIETSATPEKYTDIEEYAKHLLKQLGKVHWEGNISAPSLNTLRWGDAIYVYEPMTGLAGEYYVKSSTHTITPTSAMMQLEISFEDLLPEQLFEQFENIGGSKESDSKFKEIADRNVGITRTKTSRVPATADYYQKPLATKYTVTQRFGVRSTYSPNGHNGVDLAAPVGTPVYATADGKVLHAGYGNDTLAGIYVVIEHATGLRSIYAHLQYVTVGFGNVKKGDQIGAIGLTGTTTGAHLHFEFQQGGRTMDPEELMSLA